MIGQEFGNYRVVSKIGEGGMGAVYRTEHILIGKPAALKILLSEYSQNRRIVARFFNEAKATSAIQHRGIVEILDFGYSDDGNAYILMEFLDGEPLAARMRRTPILPLEMALRLIRQVAGALSAAHESGVVHRDLKPDNIFIIPDTEVPGGERIKLLDFGIAKLAENQSSEIKTRTGTVMGTPAYMAPEQCKGAGDVDHRADLYSIGCIMFEMLCGRRPFVADGGGEVLAQHIFVSPPVPSSIQPSITPDIDAFILRLLAKERDLRVASADLFIAELDALASARSVYVTRAGTVTPVPGSLAPPATTAPPATIVPPAAIAPGAARGAYDGTTLGDSALARPVSAHTTGARHRPWRLLVPIAALSVALFVGGVFAWRSQVKDRDDRADAPIADGPPGASATPGVVKPTPSPAQTAPARAIRIESTPTGAEIHGIGDSVVVTPFKLEIPDGETVDIRVTKDGFGEQQLTLPDAASDGSLLVALRPVLDTDVNPDDASSSERVSSRASKKKKKKKKNRRNKKKPRKSKDKVEKGETINEW